MTIDPAAIEAELRAVGRPERAEHERRYLKSDAAFLGASVPQIRAVAKARYRADPPQTGAELEALVTTLWARGVHELRVVAVELLDLDSARLSAADLPLIERLLRASHTWALVDGLAINVVGGIVDRFPREVDATLRGWATDPDLWLRRASLLAHLRGLRGGRGDFGRFSELADAMLDDSEFFIRKAIGWVLRDTARRRPDLVTEWLEPRATRASGVTVREAIRHLPEPHRRRIEVARAATSRVPARGY